jgi:hypothetical protein
MGHTNDRSTKASSLVNPTSLNLQPRPFAPLESDEKDEAISHKSGYSENFLEKIINTPRSESATPIQRKPENRLKAIATERNNASLQNQSIQWQEAAEDEKSEGEQEGGKEFTMNPEPPPVQRKFENRLRAKNAQRMAIQAKLAIGEPNDKYEQEADATAARVVQQINSPTTSQSQPVQRKFENRLRAKNAQRMEIQAKLAIGEPNDKYEQEADATAARVVQQINSSIPSQSLPIQRQEMEEDEELQMKPLVQRSENIGGGEASTDLESAIQSARGSGQSLDANLQQSMGQAMGADFSGVKVHTDSQSDQLNKSIQAKAFTTGQDLFFRQGAYEPSSRGGQELIAHELTHVVQQNGGAVQRSTITSKLKQNSVSNMGLLQRAGDPEGLMKEHHASGFTYHHIIPENKLHTLWDLLSKNNHLARLQTGLKSVTKRGLEQFNEAGLSNIKLDLKKEISEIVNDWSDEKYEEIMAEACAGKSSELLANQFFPGLEKDTHEFHSSYRNIINIFNKRFKVMGQTTGDKITSTVGADGSEYLGDDSAKETVQKLLMWMPGNIHRGPSKRFTPKDKGFDKDLDDGGDSFEEAAKQIISSTQFETVQSLNTNIDKYVVNPSDTSVLATIGNLLDQMKSFSVTDYDASQWEEVTIGPKKSAKTAWRFKKK